MIREASLSDFGAISALEGQVFYIHFNARADMLKPKKEPFNRDYFEKCLNDENIKIFVFEESGSILGHCIARKCEIKNHELFRDMTMLEIDVLCVDERARGKSIGRQLFNTVKAYAKEIGVARLELMVWEFNKCARQFYEQLGMSARISRMELIIE